MGSLKPSWAVVASMVVEDRIKEMPLSTQEVCWGLRISESVVSNWISRGTLNPKVGRFEKVKGRAREWDLADTMRLEITRRVTGFGLNPWMNETALKGKASPLAHSLEHLPTDFITERAFLLIFHETDMRSGSLSKGDRFHKIVRESDMQREITAPGRDWYIAVNLTEVKNFVVQNLPQLEAEAAELTETEATANL